MGITGIVSSYTTLYGGVPNRIHNVEVVSHLVDNTLIGPGKEFSFNGTTGERNAAKGLLEAPVIINGELENGLGGGTCQVSTTVFNAAYEAGLPITARTNHALYISHYPQGRDATVNYPDVDLKFVNDAWPSGNVDGTVVVLTDASAGQIAVGQSWAAVTLKSGSIFQLPLAKGGALDGTGVAITLPPGANDTPLGAAFWGDILGFNPAHSQDSFALVKEPKCLPCASAATAISGQRSMLAGQGARQHLVLGQFPRPRHFHIL